VGWFDEAVRRWRNEAAKAAARAAAERARRAVARAGEGLLGPGEPQPTEADDRLGRAARIRAEAEARRARVEAQEAARERAEEEIARVGAAIRRAVDAGSSSDEG
jgi:hypothetical protein